MSELTNEMAQGLAVSLDQNTEAMRLLVQAMENFSAQGFQDAADSMQSAARRMNEAAGTMAYASRK